MTDIFEEVDEDLRREQVARLWKKYGMQAIAIGAAALIIASGVVGWKSYRATKAREASLKYQEAIHPGEATSAPPAADRLAALDKIEKDLTPGYKALARFERASALIETQHPGDAAKVLETLAADRSVDETLRNVAQLKAAQLRVDDLSFNDMKTRLGKLAEPASSFRFLADELLGYSAFRAGDLVSARDYEQAITSDLAAPGDIKQRAQDMLDEIEQRLTPAARATPAPAGSPQANGQPKP